LGGFRAAHIQEGFMAVIYLRHPIHGAKVAISSHEADEDSMNGWERFDPTDPEDAAANEMAPARRTRRRATQED
jgi:hypothetical protein